MKKISILLLLLILLVFPLSGFSKVSKTIKEEFKVDTPIKAVFSYFPSPAILRCLYHSDIPKKQRKAEIIRKAEIDGINIEERAVITIIRNKFFISVCLVDKDLIIPLRLNNSHIFNTKQAEKKINSLETLNPLNALQELASLQKKIVVKDKIGNQTIEYSSYLKTTKGKVGDLKYNLELTGEDIVSKGVVRYLLYGDGNLGNDTITVSGKEKDKDYYEINESYGPVKVFTSIRVYN